MKGLLRNLLAAIQPRRSECPEMNPSLETAASNVDGGICIRNWRVEVIEPTGMGRWPVLNPGSGVQILVDGILLEKPAVVHAGQSITLTVPFTSATGRSVAAEVAEDGMAAHLHLGSAQGELLEIADQGPLTELTPTAIRREIILPEPSVEEVEALLASLGVQRGVDTEKIRRALADASAHSALVARGLAPVPANSGQIHLHLPQSQDGRPISVEVGTVLAIKMDPEPGQPGWDVFGNPLPPPELPPAQLIAEGGATLSPNGHQAIATIRGVPAAVSDRGAVRVAVRPLLIHNGNLLRSEQPLEYDGDILIDGWAEPGAIVRAAGSIHITGGAQGARLEAGHEVSIQGGCIRSVVRQGEERARTDELYKHLEDLHIELDRLGQVSRQALDHPRYARVSGTASPGPLLKLLVENRFGRLRELVARLVDLTRGIPYCNGIDEVRQLVAAVRRVVLEGNATELGEVDALLASVVSLLAGRPEEGEGARGRVVLYHLLHSEVNAAGSVEVTGPGAEQSEIISGGAVQISGHLRGGRIQAKGPVRMGRAGTPGGCLTVVSVPAGATIRVDQLYPGTICEIGSRAYRFSDEVTAVTLHLTGSGQIAVQYF